MCCLKMQHRVEHGVLWLALLAGCFLAAVQAESSFTVQGAGLKILFPPGHRQGVMDMALADFGKAQYGGSLRGKLIYPSEDAAFNADGLSRRCPDTACQYACNDLSLAKPPFTYTKAPGQFLIMMLDRGPRSTDTPCYFLSKVYHAQLAGADAVLVADDTDADLTTAVVPEDESVAHLAEELKVSAALIRKADAEVLKSLLKDQQEVTLLLNWTNLEPRKTKVSWEFWTTSNDQCGTLCKEQAAFVKAMKPYARALDQANLTQFTPHYMMWSCPQRYAASTECQDECIMNGTYCSPDPDGSFLIGYKGVDVLSMNVHHLCFAHLSKEAGLPWLWWDYAESFSANCTSHTQSYSHDCAVRVFEQLRGPELLGGQGKTKWEQCIASGSPPPPGGPTTTLQLLEDELNAQQGNLEVAAVSILPTVRINGRQFRGTLTAAGVMRAICAAFPVDQEPSVCNEQWVSENECSPGSVGYKLCKVGETAAGGRTRCINTFAGYRCECGQGFIRSVQSDTDNEVCEDVNECLATNVRLTDPACSCPRCACINLVGSYKCTGVLPDKCTPEYDYAGCWRTSDNGVTVSSCKDTINEYKSSAARGTLGASDTWHQCVCDGCLSPKSDGSGCSLNCDAAQCHNRVCAVPDAPGGASGGSTGGGGSKGGGGGGSAGGMSVSGVLLTILLSVGITAGGLYAVYHKVLKHRMEGEIRDIMSQYMPLDANGPRRGNRPSGGGNRRQLSPVDEEDLDEDAPLMGAGSAASGGSLRHASSAPLSTFRSNSMDRTPFGSLLSPPQQQQLGTQKSGGYQPPMPLPDDNSMESGLVSRNSVAMTNRTPRASEATGGMSLSGLPASTSPGAAPAAAGAPAAAAGGAAPVGDAPLLGEGQW